MLLLLLLVSLRCEQGLDDITHAKEEEIICGLASDLSLACACQELAYLEGLDLVFAAPDKETGMVLIFCGTLQDLLKDLCADKFDWKIEGRRLKIGAPHITKSYSVPLPPDSKVWEAIAHTVKQIIEPQGLISPNPQGGLLVVTCPQAQHDRVERYLYDLAKEAQKQACISITIIRVASSSTYEVGGALENVWRFLLKDPSVSASLSSEGLEIRAENPADALKALFSALSETGRIRSSSTALLSVAHNREGKLEVKKVVPVFSGNRQPMEIGSFLTITPLVRRGGASIKINFKTDLHVGDKKDPSLLSVDSRQHAFEIGEASKVPILATQSIETVVDLSRGKGVLLGGLMASLTKKSRKGGILVGGEGSRREGERIYIYVRLLSDLRPSQKPLPKTNVSLSSFRTKSARGKAARGVARRAKAI